MSEHLEHEALERVVRRAMELDDDRSEGDGVAPEALVAAANEVGISEEALRASLAVERLGAGPEGRRLDRAIGPGMVVCELTVEVPAGVAIDRLDEWFVDGHHLRREMRSAIQGEWSKRDDLAAGLQRSLRSIRGQAELGTLRTILAQTSAIDAERSIVRVVVDRTLSRRLTLGAAAGIGTASVASAVVVSSTLTPLGAVMLPGLAIAGATAYSSKRAAARTQRQLRRLLHQVAAGERPGSIGAGLARRFSRRR